MYIAEILVEHEMIDQIFSYSTTEVLPLYTRVKVEFHKQMLVGFVVGIKEYSTQPFELLPILDVIDQEPLLNEELMLLANWIQSYYCTTQIQAYNLLLPKLLKTRKNLKKPKTIEYVKIVNATTKTVRQAEAIEYLKHNTITKKEFQNIFKTVAQKLIKDGNVVVYHQERKPQVLRSIKTETIQYSPDQKHAINEILALKSEEIALLHGVTASGKSEVFYAIIEKIIENKQVLLLVPEISLVSQMVRGLLQRFNSKVALYHSNLSDQEKYEQYQLVKNNKVNLVIGTRSAMFLPFQQLGLIIIDEEHDQSYKQDNNILYDVQSIAQQRIKYHQCPLLLASATPSIYTYARCIKKIYKLIEMPNKIYSSQRNITLVDMNQQSKYQDYILSQQLINSIQKTLDKDEQVVLILNRRGYANYIKCLNCGFVDQCVNCEVALKYHNHDNMLRCHICDYKKPYSNYCANCGSYELSHYGIGTQKLEEYVHKIFPNVKIKRVDKDVTAKKALTTILEEFERKEFQILIGTQMLAKGLDFSNVTLVGMINGDDLLSRDSFQSAELMYQFLVQSFGRSGRKKTGNIVLQVYNTKHYAIKSAITENYKQFFNLEMRYRHLANYPPYVYLVSITLLNTNIQKLESDMQYLIQELKHYDYLGPNLLYKVFNQHRYRFILKSKNIENLHDIIYTIYRKYKENGRKSKIEIDFNHQSL